MPGTIHLGLIRAASHKYLKYLDAGEIARKRIDEDMKARLERNKTVPTIVRHRTKEKVNRSHRSLKRWYASALKIRKVAVLPKEYPQTNLKKEELAQLEEVIVQ